MILSRGLSYGRCGFKYTKWYSPHLILAAGSQMDGWGRFRQGGAVRQAATPMPELHSEHYRAQRLRFPSPNRCDGHKDPYPMVLDGGHGSSVVRNGGDSSPSSRVGVRHFQGITSSQTWHRVVTALPKARRWLELVGNPVEDRAPRSPRVLDFAVKKFGLYRWLFIGVLVPTHRGWGDLAILSLRWN
jgi:hypothetical protein